MTSINILSGIASSALLALGLQSLSRRLDPASRQMAQAEMIATSELPSSPCAHCWAPVTA